MERDPSEVLCFCLGFGLKSFVIMPYAIYYLFGNPFSRAFLLPWFFFVCHCILLFFLNDKMRGEQKCKHPDRQYVILENKKDRTLANACFVEKSPRVTLVGRQHFMGIVMLKHA